MRRTMLLILISLLSVSSMIQAQDKKTNVNPVDSNNYVLDPGIGGDSLLIDFIEQMPVFPGGGDALFKFISQNLRYPVSEPHLQGKVICKFIVNTDGSVSNPEIIRSLDPEYDKEAMRIVRSFPKFIPGKQDGKNIRVIYRLPISFIDPKKHVRKK